MAQREPASGGVVRAFGRAVLASTARWLEERHALAEAAFLGAVGAILLAGGDALVQALGAAPQSLPERAHLRVLGSWIDILADGQWFVKNPVYLLSVAAPLALALVVRATRPVGLALLSLAWEGLAAWLSAIACLAFLAFDPLAGTAAMALALPFALLLSRLPRWPTVAMEVVTGGAIVGLIFGVLFNDDTHVVSPVENIFLSAAAVSLAVALAIARFKKTRASWSVRRFAEMWGLSAVSLCSAVMVMLVGRQLHQARDDLSSRFVDDWAYDIALTGEPPQLVWSDKDRVHAMMDPYGKTPVPYLLDESVRFPQRIWPSLTDGVYVQTLNDVSWWPAPRGDQRIASLPAVRYPKPAGIDGPAWGFAEDIVRHRVFLTSEWDSYFAVMDHDTASEVLRGRIGTAFWPAFNATPDAAARILYLSSCMQDGTLFRIDLDSMQVVGSVPSLYLFETVLDPGRHLLWGSRPLTGEVVGIDPGSLQVRRRIPLTFGTRDLTRDPSTGDLYTCAFVSGEVFRIDVESGVVSQIGRCGSMCRNLFVDPAKNSVWVATRDRICRVPMTGGEGPGDAAPGP